MHILLLSINLPIRSKINVEKVDFGILWGGITKKASLSNVHGK